MSKKNFKRKLFVNRKLQALFSLYITIGLILITVFFAYELIKTYFVFWGFNPANHKLLDFLNNPNIIRLLILIIFTSVWYGLSIVLATNKFAGPLIRLNHILKEMQEGNFDISFRFRKKDHLYRPTEKNLNKLLEILKKKQDKRITLLNDCEKDLLKISKQLDFENKEHQETLKILSELKRSISECRKI